MIRASGERPARRRRAAFRAPLAAIAALPVCVWLGTAPSRVHAQPLEPRVSGYVTVTSDYRRRGLSESGGKTALQVGGDFQHANGFFAGAWAASVDYAGPDPASSTRVKVGYYAGYSRRIARWSFAATAVRYAYPGSAYDYDYDELSATVGYRDRLFLTTSLIDDLFGRGASAVHSEVGTALPLPLGLEIGAGLGRMVSSDAHLQYTHWNVGLSRTFSPRFGLDLRFYDANRRYAGSPVGTADLSSWVLSASYGFGTR